MQRPLNKSIGLLGGSFDPAHKGHLEISKIAIKKLKLKKLLWVVSKKKSF
jgi:nicotinate-nucleotide adenylyltransferase